MLGTLADAQRGITAASREGDQRPEDAPSPSPSLLSALPAEVPFDFDASVFPDSWVLQWVDGFADVPQFTVVPVEPAVSRTYRDELTQCEILLFAGPDSTPLGSSDDDRTLSDAQLDFVLGWGEDAIAEFAFDHTIPQPGQNGSIAARVITGSYEGSSTATAARVIKSQGQAAYVYVSCPGRDATPEFDMLMETGVLALTAAPPSS